MIYVFILIFITLFLISIKYTKSIFSFPSFVILFWSSYSVVAYFFTKSEYAYSFMSFTFFTLMFIALLAGYLIRYYIKSRQKKKFGEVTITHKPKLVFLSKRLYLFGMGLMFILALLNVFFNVKAMGFSIKNLTSVSNILEISSTASDLRYSNNEPSSVYISLTLPFVYALPLFAGFNLAIKINWKSLLLSIFAFIPSLCILVILNTKAVFIGSSVFCLSAFIVGWFTVRKSYIRITLKLLLIAALLGFGFIALMAIAFGMRAGNLSFSFLTSLKERFIDYAFAGLPAFDDYLVTRYDHSMNFIGNYTFLGIWNLLGISDRSIGVFSDYTYFGIYKTNVYTAFRGLITDYSITGSILIFIIIGYLSNFLEERVKLYDSSIASGLYILLYSFFIYAIIISIFTYNSYILAFMMFILLLLFWPRRDQDEYQSLL